MTVDANQPESLGFIGGLRAIVRLLAAAVYAQVAWGLLAGLVSASAALSTSAHTLLAALAGWVLGRATDGPAWSTAPVGLAIALLDVVLAFALATFTGVEPSLTAPYAVHLALAVLAGAGGAFVGRRTAASARAP
jgi:hypothetical protein